MSYNCSTYKKETLRKRDMFVEKQLAAFLDKSLYKYKLFKDVERVEDYERQLLGIDVIFSIPDLYLSKITVDEKAQLRADYIGSPLPTFALELSFIDSAGQEQIGWFIDSKKKTQYYLLIWIEDADEKEYMKTDDINKLNFCLVNRNSLLDYLSEQGYSKDELKKKSDEIRNNPKKGPIDKDKSRPFYFFYSSDLAEKPINIIIRKQKYLELSALHGNIVKDSVNRVYHIKPHIPKESRINHNSMNYDESHIFTRKRLEHILNQCINKTLGEVDRKHIFERTLTNPKITGIAGDVIEQSVLGYPADQRQEPDLLVDGIQVELKTTGIRKSKKIKEVAIDNPNKNLYDSKINTLYAAEPKSHYAEHEIYEAKEPMSITAVSPKTIVNEVFNNSNFWHKLEHLLLVYYLYDSEKTVTATEYANFPIKGFEFHEFSEDDKNVLRNDWQIVHDFIKTLQSNYSIPENEYPRISHELRNQLMYIDTAPKWPNPPRFRLKRSFVTTMVQNYFGNKTEILSEKVLKYSDIDNKCTEIEKKFSGLSVRELATELKLQNNLINKSIGEQLVIKMFNGTSGKMNDIDIFKKSGLLGKTIVLTSEGKGTEDFKFFSIDFEEIQQPDLQFEDSSFYKYFAEHMFLCVLFQEPYKPETGKRIPLEQNKFVGFKRVCISEDFIQTEVRKTWLEIRDLVNNDKLIDVVDRDKFGNAKINKTGVVRSAPNFPKSKTNAVFVRGTSADSTIKNECVNGIRMYVQDVWIRRAVFINMIKEIK